MRKTYLLLIIPVLILGMIALCLYRPPLLARGGRNPIEGFFDHLAFAWYFTKATWRESQVGRERALPDLARAVWYRPSFSREVFGLLPSDYSGLARQFESLGLDKKAGRLFLAAYFNDPGPEQAQESVLACLGLGDWKGVSLIAADITHRHPDFGKGYYWGGRAILEEGRPEDAIEKLNEAAGLIPEGGDIFFRIGEAWRTLGKDGVAEAEYRKAVSLSPNHREAWKALSELYQENGKDGAAGEAQGRVSALTADRPVRVRFEDGLIFLGCGNLPSAIRGEEGFPFVFYCEFPSGAADEVRPYLRFQAGRFQKRLFLKAISPSFASLGGVLIESRRPVPPWDICPLPSEVLIGFLDGSSEPIRIFNSREYELKLGETKVKPSLFSCPHPDPGLSGIAWKDITDLRKRTILAGGEEVKIEVADSGPVVAIGLISYTEGTIRVPQGTEIATVQCLGPEGAWSEYPIRLGLETADRWLESRDPHVPRHQTARTFYSQQVEGKRSYRWHYYQALLPLPEPGGIKELSLKYTYPSGGCWVVKNVFLLESPPDPD